jgi:DNA end-binding protein Ku
MAATVWKGHLSFGLISIPVKLYRAARAERVSLHHLHRAGAARGEVPRTPEADNVVELPRREAAEPEPEPEPEAPVERVRQVPVAGPDTRPIPRSDLLKGYELAEGQWAVIGKEDLKRIAPRTSKVIDILEFVHFAEIDPVYLESSYYVAPEPAGAKAYAILYQSLKETGFAALARVAMHNREHTIVVRPGRTGLLAHTLFYENEVRGEQEFLTDPSLASRREIDLAAQLIRSLAGKFEPGKYRDTYREQLEELIRAKAEGKELAAAAAPPPAPAGVLDLADALEKSLQMSRRPPAQAAPPKKRGRREKRG